MLKPAAPNPPPEPDRSIGDLAEQLLDDAVAYGRAEIELLRARAVEMAESYARAAVLVAVAVVLGLAAVVTLFAGIAFALARWLGPLGGAIVSALLAATIAGLLVWLAVRDVSGNP